ncbi:MAG TPA: hypothetical protein VFQ41_22185 [Candidatus Angelobacter sp.]|nr:hypothetical protein [Candidatus Angelobacter sp.]
MSLLTALSLLDILVFCLSLFVFAYFFNRFSGRDETVEIASILHEMNIVEQQPQAAKAKARAAGAA